MACFIPFPLLYIEADRACSLHSGLAAIAVHGVLRSA